MGILGTATSLTSGFSFNTIVHSSKVLPAVTGFEQHHQLVPIRLLHVIAVHVPVAHFHQHLAALLAVGKYYF